MMQKWLKQIRLSLSKFISRFTDIPIPIGMGNTVEGSNEGCKLLNLTLIYEIDATMFKLSAIEREEDTGKTAYLLTGVNEDCSIRVSHESFNRIFTKV